VVRKDTEQRKTAPTADVPAGVRARALSLEELIERTRDIPRSPEQLRAQRRSFAFGNCNIENPHVTREVIARADADFDRIFGSD
jgi:hypothetical protein